MCFLRCPIWRPRAFHTPAYRTCVAFVAPSDFRLPGPAPRQEKKDDAAAAHRKINIAQSASFFHGTLIPLSPTGPISPTQNAELPAEAPPVKAPPLICPAVAPSSHIPLLKWRPA